VVKQGTKVMTGGPDTYHGYGLAWANASNTPFREYKHWVHEGGISSPLIAHWPKGIDTSRHGKLERQPGHLIDLMATCVDLAGAVYPGKVGDTKIVPLQGTSLSPAFNGHNLDRKKPIFWEHEGNRAMREGKWKLVAKGARGAWELYDIEADRTELNNLAGKMPERLKAMASRWEAWAVEAHAKPWPWGGAKKNVKFNKKKVFALKQGDRLDRTRAPMVHKKGFSITATVTAKGHDGVIIAQGGVTHGWALYLKDDRLNFATRHAGKLTNLSAKTNFPNNDAHVSVTFATDGAVLIKVNGQKVIEDKTPGTMVEMPLDGLEVGVDLNGAVGSYPADVAFKGAIRDVTLKLQN
jgi:arylsulfatase